MAEDFLLAGNYDDPCLLCEEPLLSPLRPSNITLPPHPTFLQPALQAQVFEAPCMSSSAPVEPQVMVTFTELVKVRLSYFTSRTAPLLPLQPVSGETSAHTLPSISSDAPLMPPKKKTFSTDQLVQLEHMFQYDRYPDGDTRKDMAAAFGVTPQRITVWFQNRRAKLRKTAKATAKNVPSHSQPCIQVNRPPIFTGPAVAPAHPNPGNTLQPFSTILTSSTSPPACVDVGPCVSQGGFLEYVPPRMHSPPPIWHASLPRITTYHPPSYNMSLLLDTPEHNEASSTATMPLGLQSDPGGHTYLQSQTGNQMLLQSGVHAFQNHLWTTDVYDQSGQFTQAVFRPQLSSRGHEGHYHQLPPQQHYEHLRPAYPNPPLTPCYPISWQNLKTCGTE